MIESFVAYSHSNMWWLARHFYCRKVDKDLLHAGMGYGGREYTSFSVALGISLSVLAMATAIFTAYWIPASILVFTVAYAVTVSHPSRAASARARKAEKELPEMLREIAIELDSGMSFEKAIETHSRDPGVLGAEFAKAAHEMRNGSSVQEALASLSARGRSRKVMKAMNTMIAAHGKSSRNTGEGMMNMANDLARQERALVKEYHAKLAVYSLIFITFSAVIPAMYQAFVIIGSGFLEVPISPEQALLIPALIFPAINFMIISFVLSRRP